MFPGRSTEGWSEPRLFFGLGASDKADRVRVEWPSG